MLHPPLVMAMDDIVQPFVPFEVADLVVYNASFTDKPRISREQFVLYHKVQAIIFACPQLKDGRSIWCPGMAYEWEPADAFMEWWLLGKCLVRHTILLTPQR